MKTRLIPTSILAIALLLQFSFTGCKKDIETVPEQPKSIFDIQVSPEFKWQTVQNLTLEVTGMAVPVVIKNNLTIKSEDGTVVYYTGPAEMSKNYTINFSVPSYVKKLVVSFGTKSKLIELSGTTLTFNHIVE
jgi:hypothetical protein